MQRAASCSRRLLGRRTRSFERAFTSSSSVQLTRDGRRVVLGIESSCDDSCAAICVAPTTYGEDIISASSERLRNSDGEAELVTSIVLKQDHSLTSGIQPLIAANSHAASLPHAIVAALREAKSKGFIASITSPVEIDAIAVTQGPGMGASLASGLGLSKMLSALWERPLVYTHHMAAHALTPFLRSTTSTVARPHAPPLVFPFLTLLLSGGHTLLVLCKGPRSFKILATTNDDSIGDAFDKVSRGLKIDVDWASTSPGAALEAFVMQRAEGGEQESEDKTASKRWSLPVPLKNKPEFSYSGLKSAVQRQIEELERAHGGQGQIPDSDRRSLARAFQLAAFAQLESKIRMNLSSEKQGEAIKALVVSGGVASNEVLRKRLRGCLDDMGRGDVELHFPPISLCTDNAAMIAHAALLDYQPTFDLTKSPRAKWSLEDL